MATASYPKNSSGMSRHGKGKGMKSHRGNKAPHRGGKAATARKG